MALEYSGEAPKGDLTAQVSEFVFSEPVKDGSGEVTGTNEIDTFDYGADEVSVLFDYSAMKDGQDVVFKVYIDDEEILPGVSLTSGTWASLAQLKNR